MFWLFDSVQDGAEVFAVGWYDTNVVNRLKPISTTCIQLCGKRRAHLEHS